MRISTVAELAGFTCLVAAAWLFGAIPGLVVTGAVLLLIGYMVEDDLAELPFRRAAAAMKARRAARRTQPTA
jgi:hypothetical protein